MISIRRALLSVSDKTDLLPLARALHRFNCELIATGGTGRALAEARLPITDIAAVSGTPEAFDGRVKTVSFPLLSAILFHRERHREEAVHRGVAGIDMVVCNLYPFEQVRAMHADHAYQIENIDIGGPTLVRAAAKNYEFVTVVSDPADYPLVIEALAANHGAIPLEMRRRFMRKAFRLIAQYDAAIAAAMDEDANERSFWPAFDGGKELRYGENPHQKAQLFRRIGATSSLYDCEALSGKDLSFNNLVDLYNAVEAVQPLRGQACAVVKHTNPCGLCEADDQRIAMQRAWQGDPVSAFGSVIAFNHKVEKETVTFLNLEAEDRRQRKFVEVVGAPEFSESARRYLQTHKQLRAVRVPANVTTQNTAFRMIGDALLVQQADRARFEKLDVVTKQKVNHLDGDLITFGIHAVRMIKSNAIAVVRRTTEGACQLIGMGCGQPNRVVAVHLAVSGARDVLADEFDGGGGEIRQSIRAEMAKAILVSDAYFPFPDSIETLVQAGIQLVVQPGGSRRDGAVIAACDRKGISMVFTGLRHFLH